MSFPFSMYSFIKREHGNWVSLGYIKDETAGDAISYDYSLPNSKAMSVAEGEGLAMKMLAETAYLTLPVQASLDLKWKVSSQETIDFIESNVDILQLIAKASPKFEICLMEDNYRELFEKEASGDSAGDTDTSS